MTKLTRVAVVAMIATALGLSAAPDATAAPASMSTPMPMSSQWRACDFTDLRWVPAVGDARPVARVGTDGAGSVVATVDIDTALPNTFYDVRVIQTPRPSSGCATGAAGVLTGGLQTNAVGVGSTTVQGPVAKGATGAWVVVERPSGSSQTPAEFYSTEFIAAI
jgi:hypothetical protein